jgi:hypothetical protein
MTRHKDSPIDRSTELLETLIVIELHKLGARQDQIAKVVGRQKLWVNGILKGLPKPVDN